MTKLSLVEIDEKQERLRTKISELQQLDRAYELVRADLAQANGSSQSVGQSTVVKPAPSDRTVPPIGTYGRATKLIRDELQTIDGAFTIRDVHQRLIRIAPDLALGSVTTVFSGMVTREEIEVKRQGRGRQAAIYEKGPKFAAET